MDHPRRLLGVVLAFALAGTVGAQGELVIVKDGTYHRPACPVIRDATDVLAMSVGQAEARGFKSHPECDPNVAKPAGPPGAAVKPAKPIYVFVDARGTLYHKETCRKLGKAPVKVELTASVAKKYWPCGVCKPPVLPRPPKKQ